MRGRVPQRRSPLALLQPVLRRLVSWKTEQYRISSILPQRQVQGREVVVRVRVTTSPVNFIGDCRSQEKGSQLSGQRI